MVSPGQRPADRAVAWVWGFDRPLAQKYPRAGRGRLPGLCDRSVGVRRFPKAPDRLQHGALARFGFGFLG